MNNQQFINLLKLTGDFKLEVSRETNSKIINNIYNPLISGAWINTILRSVIIRPALAIFFVLILIFSILQLKNSKVNKDELYNIIISQIKEINIKRNSEMALNIYSEDFYNHISRAELKKNIEILFNNYSDINYEPVKKKVIIKGNKALIENNIKYSAAAYNSRIKPITYKGKERIYLKRHNNNWKIIAWVYEEN